MKIHPVSERRRLRCFAAILIAGVLAATPPATANEAPIADAGRSRYVANEPIRLDGTGSSDPDGEPIVEYRWVQVSGPAVEIVDADTATPEVGGFIQAVYNQTVEIELTVGDGALTSTPDSVEIVIVPRMIHRTMSLLNGPFRPELPTLLTFGGGNCVDGRDMHLNAAWQARFNIITGPYFFPYADHAHQIMVLLSSFAPEYRQPIQTVGFSTGGNPAVTVADVINRFFADPRYAVNRVTLLDTYCDDALEETVAGLNSHPVPGETLWVEVYRSLPEPIPGALNLSFFPGGDHNTPLLWFLESIEAATWPDGDMFNDGVTAGFFVSVGGPARDLMLAAGDLVYYFECPQMGPGCLRRVDPSRHPGSVPEPVQLVGPVDGAAVGPFGSVLSCQESRHAVSYELLLGPDPGRLDTLVAQTPEPPEFRLDDLPFSPTYWTVLVRDAFGSAIQAPARAIHPYEPDPPRRARGRHSPNP